jgi:hypothetical protein
MAATARKFDVNITDSEAEAAPRRSFAGVFDLRLKGPTKTYGTNYSPEYIGGCGGIYWFEYYRDDETGEVYEVYCSDGVNGGNNAHTVADGCWLNQCYRAIVERCLAESETGQTVIWLSWHERVIMERFTHYGWLDGGKQSCEPLESRFIGMCRGIPVVWDESREDQLPPR